SFLAAGTPARATEEGPQLKKYLTWLEMNPDNRAANGPVAEPVLAVPVQAVQVPAPARGGDFDVELLPTAPTPGQTMWQVTNRDWVFLGLGAAGVIVAGLVGFAMAW